MKFTRRNALIAMAVVVMSSGALVGTGAFSSVEADRTVNVNTAGDDSALLQITEGQGASSSEIYATAGNQVSLNQSSLNADANTTFEQAVNVTNTGSENVTLYIDDADAGIGEQLVIKENGGSSIVGTSTTDGVSLPAGQTVELDVVIALRSGSVSDIGSSLTIIAE